MMTDNTALPEPDGKTVTAGSDKPPAKKAAAKKAAAPDQGQADRTGASGRKATETLKYAYTADDDGNVTSLAPCGSTDTLFEYVKANPGKAFRFIDGPKGADVIALINASI